MDDVVELYDQGASGFLLLNGVRLLGVRFTPEKVYYRFENRNGEAVQSLKLWRRGTVMVPARAYRECLRTLSDVVRKSRPTPGEYHGDGYAA